MVVFCYLFHLFRRIAFDSFDARDYGKIVFFFLSMQANKLIFVTNINIVQPAMARIIKWTRINKSALRKTIDFLFNVLFPCSRKGGYRLSRD